LNLAPTMMAAIPLSSNSHGTDCKLRIQNLWILQGYIFHML
jgi:hypothetical protein